MRTRALFWGGAAGVPLAGASDVTAQVSILKGERNFLTGYDPHNLDGTVNAVIEISAGTTAKYETIKKTGMIELEQKNGAPRYVQYLGYPVNYGLIPRTVLPKSKGGDGDPLDALVLGAAVPTGSIVKTRPLGVLTLVDGGEKDDKIILAAENSPFAVCRDIDDLNARFPGVTTSCRPGSHHTRVATRRESYSELIGFQGAPGGDPDHRGCYFGL
jgi:inorganic pyrophosphatase